MKRGARFLRTDTVVIGAGAAGLAAASELVSAGARCIVLEARPRIGGRVYTQPVAAGPSLELGAEFIHGESAPTRKRLDAHRHVAVDAPTERWILHRRLLRRADGQLDALKRYLRRLPAPEEQASFADYLTLHRRRLPSEVRRFALTLVKGFDAADPTRIGAREVIDEWSGPAAADQATFRPVAGYGPLLEAMRASMPSRHVRFVLRAVVHRVRWGADGVEVQASQDDRSALIVRARRAIVTLPLGVLQSAPGERGHVVFDPPLAAKARALSQLHSGPVHKVVLCFRRAFWTEHDDGRYRNAGFFFAPGVAFPTFWTALPWRAPHLVAWCAGPDAEALLNCTGREIRRHVYASLAPLFGRRRYDSLLEHCGWHDWQRDPFARGAYSYVAPGGAQARAMLGRPLGATLYFAGEACDTSGEAATVGGALRSGQRAARQVLRSVSSR